MTATASLRTAVARPNPIRGPVARTRAVRPARRARPDAAAARRPWLRLTSAEYSAVKRLAKANGLKLTDAVRLGVLYLAARLDEDGAPPIVLGGSLMITEAPDPDDGLLPPKRRRDVRHS